MSTQQSTLVFAPRRAGGVRSATPLRGASGAKSRADKSTRAARGSHPTRRAARSSQDSALRVSRAAEEREKGNIPYLVNAFFIRDLHAKPVDCRQFEALFPKLIGRPVDSFFEQGIGNRFGVRLKLGAQNINISDIGHAKGLSPFVSFGITWHCMGLRY